MYLSKSGRYFFCGKLRRKKVGMEAVRGDTKTAIHAHVRDNYTINLTYASTFSSV